MNKEKKQNGQKFFKVPFFLLQREEYKSLSADAILLYGLLLDRVTLSEKNADSFTDEMGEIYVICTINEIMQNLRCCNRTAIKLLNDLANVGLIEKKHGGYTRASRIKVKNIHFESEKYSTSDSENNYISGCENSVPEMVNKIHYDSEENDILESKKSSLGIVKNIHPNHTNINHTYNNQTYHPFISVDEIRERVEYDIIKYDANAEIIAELIEVMAETYSVTSREIRIGGTKYAADFVKSRLDKITSEHITDVAYKIANCNSKVKMTKNYMLRLLFDSPATMMSEVAITYHQNNYQ